MKVLVIEDEVSISSFIKKGLEENGFIVEQSFDGEMGLRLVANNKYDIILLDVILPGLNGYETCKKIRALNISTPIIMLTALGATDDIVDGLTSGADDYITKPFKFKELIARIQAVSRRGSSKNAIDSYVIDDLKVDDKSKTVTRESKKIELTAKEYNLLLFLVKNKGRVLSRMSILENVWDSNFDFGTNVVDVYINYLRNKIDKGYDKRLIHTVVGMGYVLKEDN